MPRYRIGLTAGLLALVCGWLCTRPAAAQVVVSSISARVGHTATLLPNRNILIVGGSNGAGAPVTDDAANGVYQVEQVLDSSWTVSAAHMAVPRSSHTATLLPNGEVLAVGGWSGAAALGSAEVYNPVLNCWHTAITVNCTARYDHTATLLLDGTVLICGGTGAGGPGSASLNTCDIFTPAASASACGSAAGTFSATHPGMLQGRSLHTATKLPDEPTDVQGRVFFSGGFDPTLGAYSYLTTTEIFDNGYFKSAYPLSQARAQHTATLMGNGKVLIVGGFGNYDGTPIHDKPASKEPYSSDTFGYLQSTEIYDPVGDNMVYSQSIFPAGAAFVRLKQHTATLLADGSVEVLGGAGNFSNSYTGAYSQPLSAGSIVTDNASSQVTNPSTSLGATVRTKLTDFEGLAHNVSGVIAKGEMYFTRNKTDPAKDPTVTFSVGKVTFTPGDPDAGNGLKLLMDGTTVYCNPVNDDDCGYFFNDSPLIPDNLAGTVTLDPDLPLNIDTVASLDGGRPTWSPAFKTLCTATSGDMSNLNGGSITADLTLTNLPAEFPNGATISNATLVINAGKISVPMSNGDPGLEYSLTNAQASGLTGTVGSNPTFSNVVLTSLTGTVKLSTNACTPPISGSADADVTGRSLTSPSGKLSTYQIDRLDLANKTLVADNTVVVVRQMAFGDIEQYKPNKAPASWGYPSGGHAVIAPRFGHTLTLTSRGASNIIGGWTCDPSFWGTGSCPMKPVPNYTTRVWNNFSWSPAKAFVETSGTMFAKRAYHTATTLPDGNILVAGGTNGPNVLQSAEILDPRTGSFVPAGNMKDVRDLHTATLLPNGRVLVAGGYSTSKVSTGAIQGAEIYYPDTRLWLPTSVMISSRSNHTATALSDGNVLVLGGYANNAVSPVLKTAEVYYSTSGVWRSVPDMLEGRFLHTATLMRDGRVLVVGGQGSTGLLTTVLIFNPLPGYSCWEGPGACPAPYGVTPAPLPGGARVRYHTATMLMDGRVMVAGGNDGNGEIGNVWLYDPAKNTWAAGTSLSINRQNHTATLLPNGTVLAAGGAQAAANGGAPNRSVEQYDPGRNRWVSWGSADIGLSTYRAYHTMTMAKDGTLYAIGGFSGSAYLKSTDNHVLYSSGLDEFSVDWPPSTRRGQIYGTDEPVLSRGDVFTTTGTRFHGLTEASGGGSGGANSDHRHPRLVLQAVDGSGGGASQSNSGFIVDLTTQIAVSAALNVWSQTDSSITVQMPAGMADGILVPYGWYHLRAGANDQLSESYMLRAGPHLPSAQVDNLGAYNSGSLSTVGLSSVTFTWNTPAGLTAGVDFDGYNVYVATTGVFISTRPDSGNCHAGTTPCNFITLNGLVPSSTQAIWVTPYNISGDYAGSPASSAAYTLPHEPVDVFIASTSANSFFVKWSTADPSGQPYNGTGTLYEAYQSLRSDFATIVETFSLTQANFAPDSPLTLTPNIQYFFRVRACNLHGSPYGECSDWGLERPIPPAVVGVNRYVSTQTMTGVFNVTGSAYSTDTIKWAWTAAAGGVHYNVINATVPFNDPKHYIAVDVSTNHYTQTSLSQNTRSVIQVHVVTPGWVPGSPQGPLSDAATAYSLATPPIFTDLSCPRTPNVDITTGSIIVAWGTRPGGPGPEGKANRVTYEIQYATGPWNRTTGDWNTGVTNQFVRVRYDDTNPNHTSTTTILEGINQAVPIYVRGRTLNTLGQTLDRAVNPDFPFTDEWTDLISSYDAVGARPDGADRFTSTLPMAPTVFYVIPPTGPMSATLWWMDQVSWQPDPARLGYPRSNFQVLQTTCTGFDVDGTLQPQFNTSTGPDCGVVPTGLGFPFPPTDPASGVWFPQNTALVSSLKTWVTYYFTISVENIPHWEGIQPNVQQNYPTTASPLPHYYTSIPGVASGSLAVNVTASTGGSVSNGTVGLFDPKTNPPQVQHFVSLSAPGGAFPSDTVLTISTFAVTTDSRYATSCPGSSGFSGDNPCGGDNNLAFEITANPPLQPRLPLYFTVTYNSTVPQEPAPDGVALNPKQAILLRFDPASCKCVPMRSPASPGSNSITAEINHLSIFQVGSWPAAATPEFMRIYPNPYYTSREPWLTIDGLPAGSRVRIFTLRGEMVLDSNADSNGIFNWQGANRGGRAVASGVYLVVAEGNGIKAIRKLAVIR